MPHCEEWRSWRCISAMLWSLCFSWCITFLWLLLRPPTSPTSLQEQHLCRQPPRTCCANCWASAGAWHGSHKALLDKSMFSAVPKNSTAQTTMPILPCCVVFAPLSPGYLLGDSRVSHPDVYLGGSIPCVCRTDALPSPSPLRVPSFFFFFFFSPLFRSSGYFNAVNIFFLTVSDMNKSVSSPPSTFCYLKGEND